MAQKVIIKATNIAPYGKGWQVNAFVDGVESETTFYAVPKELPRLQLNIYELGDLKIALMRTC